MNLHILVFVSLGVRTVQSLPSTMDPSFQLSLDGFMLFLKELPVLRQRLEVVKQTGRSLSSRVVQLEAAFLDVNSSVVTPRESIVLITQRTRHLDVRVKNITGVISSTKQRLQRLQGYTDTTTETRVNLTALADDCDKGLSVTHDVIHNLTSSLDDMYNTTNNLMSGRDALLKTFQGLAQKAEKIELMGCDSGFGDVHGGLPQTSALRYSHPFYDVPSIMYSLTHMDIIHSSSWNYNVNVTVTNVTKSGMTVTVQKGSHTQLRDSEYNWMTCYA
ncbi:uncharacterized protein LOC124148576 [Haliotis rufescens]|uniref:uncharacterized protein LOC124148576 n=1 Tax=Haliotis rufescens TaxID=6454 RepID=UPI00201F61C6|nr:uncharacterized protein LOC124148576 [Haliotis rufescens]